MFTSQQNNKESMEGAKATGVSETSSNETVSIDQENQNNMTKEGVEVCQFYLAGKCRFGDDCRNRHEGTPMLPKKSQRKIQGDKKVKEEKGKLPSMKTAADVISRLQWDRDLPTEHFVVGYLDRFLGVLEQPFTAFSWEDLASVDDFEVLAVPQHRIQYFKYRGEKVWDKASRLDLVFGSQGEERSIKDVMDQVDARKEEEFEESEDEEDLVVIGEQREEDHVEALLLAEEDRSTHFLSIRITDPEVIRNLVKVQDSITGAEPILRDCCMKESLFHLTLTMLRLQGAESEAKAKVMMKKLQPKLAEMLADNERATLDISGLGNFGQRVVYASVQPRNAETFQRLVGEVHQALEEAGEGVKGTNNFEFVPHVTVAKVSRPVARERHSKYVPTSHYSEHCGKRMGSQVMDNFHLCVIEQDVGRDGFYSTLASIKL